MIIFSNIVIYLIYIFTFNSNPSICTYPQNQKINVQLPYVAGSNVRGSNTQQYAVPSNFNFNEINLAASFVNDYQSRKFAEREIFIEQVQNGPRILIPKYYAYVNEEKGESHWDYENVRLMWSFPDKYEFIKKIGKGKFSEVFFSKDITDNSDCVIKILKPVKKRKIKREIKILQSLRHGPNIVQLLNIVKDPQSKIPSLVFELLKNTNFKVLYPQFTLSDIKHYIFQLLRAIEYSHSQGIMHRDVKPDNVMIDHETRTLKLIDWGLAEFYHPGQEYSVIVATRYYKSPELIVGMKYYDYSMDVWSVGCMLAGMMFMSEPFFYSHDDYDQLVKITSVLGTKEFYSYLKMYKIELPEAFKQILGNRERKPWESFITNENKHLVTQDAFELLNKMLLYDHTERITAMDAMKHRYFDDVRTRTNM